MQETLIWVYLHPVGYAQTTGVTRFILVSFSCATGVNLLYDF